MREQVAAERRGDAGADDLDELHGEALEESSHDRLGHPQIRPGITRLNRLTLALIKTASIRRKFDRFGP